MIQLKSMSLNKDNSTSMHSYNIENSIKHWLRKLQEDYNYIEKNLKYTSTHQVVPVPLVEYIFIISKKLKLSVEVKFLAVDLFDRFIRNQFKSVYMEIFKTSSSLSSNNKQWNKVETRICNQLELRVLSCLQIASKFAADSLLYSRIISARDIYEFMDEEVSFSMEEIKNSEFRVFKTLNFQVNKSTIITFIDAILTSIYSHLFQKPEFDFIQEKCYQVCEILYLNHQEIFHNFYYKLTGLWERSYKDRIHFSTVECNGLIKSAAVILTAAQLFHISKEEENNLITELIKITNSNKDYVYCLSNTIFRIIFQ